MRTHIRLGKLEGLLHYESMHPDQTTEIPYKIVPSKGWYYVRRKSDNKLIGTHPTRRDARTQIIDTIMGTKRCGIL